MSNKKLIWCPLAFNGLLSTLEGRYHTCCYASQNSFDPSTGKEINRETYTIDDAFNNEYFRSIRRNLKNGVKDKNCDICWREEENGVESGRQHEIKRLHDITPDFENKQLKYLDIALGNQCNLRCRSCNTFDSSKWAKEHFDLELKDSGVSYKDFKKSRKFLEKTDSKIVKSLLEHNLPYIDYLSFLGGEPFLMKSTWYILEYSVEKGYAKNIHLVFDTNATFWDYQKINILNKFKKVTLRLSIDGIRNRFEYLRYPASWDTVLKNIQSMVDWKNTMYGIVDLHVNCTVSAYNIYYVDEIVDFCNTHNLIIFIIPVEEPESISIKHIPNAVKHLIKQKLTLLITKYKNTEFAVQLNKLLYHLNSECKDANWSDFLNEVHKRDVYREESFTETFPEFANLIAKLGYYHSKK